MVLPCFLQFEQDIFELQRAAGVQSAEGLVENHEAGLVQDGGDKLHLLLHSLGELLDLGMGPAAQFQPLQPLMGAAGGLVRS